MKSLPSLATLSLTLLSVSTPLFGQHEMQRGRDFAKGQGHADLQRSFLRRDEPAGTSGQAVPAAAQRPEELKPAPLPGVVSAPRLERMSPEERRQLRRDINAAGREIYRRPKPE